MPTDHVVTCVPLAFIRGMRRAVGSKRMDLAKVEKSGPSTLAVHAVVHDC